MIRKFHSLALTILGLLVLAAGLSYAQTPAAATVPHLVHFAGVARDLDGKPMSGTLGITFALYAEQTGGAALWLETQNVQADGKGNYSVELGAASAVGLPMDVFASGEARWLGVEIAGQAEQTRILLLAVPYALKAADAETIGGLPASAFVRAAGANGGQATGAQSGDAQPAGAQPAGAQPAKSASETVKTNSPYGTANYLPLWTSASTIQNSNVFQSTAGNVGIGTTAPGHLLEVDANTNDAQIAMESSGTDAAVELRNTASGGREYWIDSGSGSSGVGAGNFGIWDNSGGGARLVVTATGNVGIDTTSPGATLAVNGTGSFGGPVSVAGNLSATGVVTGSSYNIGSYLFAFGPVATNSAFLGYAGNPALAPIGDTAVGSAALASDTAQGGNNTAIGEQALADNSTGSYNAASGVAALELNQTGSYNTATGASTLVGNATGSGNTADGYFALNVTTTGSGNTGIGADAGLTHDGSFMTGSNNTFLGTNTEVSTGTLTNVTVIGANSGVTESNALVLGCIVGESQSCPVGVNVGIGTTAPAHLFEVDGSVSGPLISTAGTGSDAAIAVNNSGSGGRQYWIDSASSGSGLGSGNFGVYDATANATRLVITSTGAVGINTTSPDNNLSVNGSADKPGGGSWGTFSDRRLKNLDGSFSSGLSEVLKINPVKYRYKDDNGMGIRDRDEHIGVVAQEIQKAIPEAVTENSKGYLLVNNDPILWAMLNAIKEQQGMIEQQKETIRAQAVAMKAQQARMDTQQTQIKQLTRQVREVRAALKANGKSKSTVESVKETAPMLHQ